MWTLGSSDEQPVLLMAESSLRLPTYVLRLGLTGAPLDKLVGLASPRDLLVSASGVLRL